VFGGTSWKLARLFGIRICVHGSWFLILFLFIFWLQEPVRDSIAGDETTAYLVTVGMAAAFFASIVVHEIGHALAARRAGIEVTGIDLFFFGGLMRMNRDTETPGQEFSVAAAGPAVTLLVTLGAGAGALALSDFDTARGAAEFSTEGKVGAGLMILSWLALVNAGLFAFNLIPAYPLDGGRMARAVAWRATGDRERGTRFAAGIGQGFSWLLIAGGILWAASGAVVNGVWMVALGWLIGQAARGAVAQTRFSERLRGVTVADLMDAEPVAIPASLDAARAFEEFFLRYGYDWFAVTEGDGRLVGPAHRPAVEHAVEKEGGSMPIRELVARDTADEGRIRDTASLETLLGSQALRRLGALMAVDDRGRLRGVITLDQVTRALQSKLAPTN
jgi:Zn-dependent protease